MRNMPLQYCKNCNRYTLRYKCQLCGGDTINPSPARFSPQDHYGKYRRILKKTEKKTI
ncbi:MAG: RNA-protein complex protein Nop10 [Candidatus Thermoplasmatota archaeon]